MFRSSITCDEKLLLDEEEAHDAWVQHYPRISRIRRDRMLKVVPKNFSYGEKTQAIDHTRVARHLQAIVVVKTCPTVNNKTHGQKNNCTASSNNQNYRIVCVSSHSACS